MEIRFANNKVRKLCEDGTHMQRKLGAAAARKLLARLADLQAAAHLDELPAGNPHPLSGEYQGCVGIRIDGGLRLVIRPLNEPLPLLPDGGLDRRAVTIVCIVFIGDYHD